MKIIFDNIVFSQQRAGGISVVWYELLKRVMKEQDIQPVFIEYQGGQLNYFRKLLELPVEAINLRSNLLLKIRRYFNPRIQINEKTIFHSSYYRTCNHPNALNITTVHDFTYEKYYRGIAKWLHCKQKYKAISSSDKIICISENTKKDLQMYLPDIDEKKIKVIYNGVSEDYHKIDVSKVNQLPFPAESYIIFVGSRMTYKRFDFAVDFAQQYNLKIIIVGGGPLTKNERLLLDNKIYKNNYAKLDAVPNSTLNILYNSAFCLFYPSEYEGFGIPLVEAQKACCPVIAYDGSSIKEIANNSALLFSDYNLTSLRQFVDNLKNTEFRNELIRKGVDNATRFSWNKTYEEYIKVYSEVLTFKIL